MFGHKVVNAVRGPPCLGDTVEPTGRNMTAGQELCEDDCKYVDHDEPSLAAHELKQTSFG